MSHIIPPTKREIEEYGRQSWHKVFDPHFDDMVAWGYIDGAAPVSYGGTVSGLTNAAGEVAFREGSTLANYGADLAADTVYIVSSSSSDTQVYSVQGINAAGVFTTVTVTATGTTPAALSGTWNHIQRFICTGADNVGTVYLSTKSGAGVPTTTGDQIQCVMEAGMNYAINPELRAANNQIITISNFAFYQDATQTATINIYANRQGKWIINFRFFAKDGDNIQQQFHTPLRLVDGGRMRVTITAGGGASVAASFGMNGNQFDVSNPSVTKAGMSTVFPTE